MSERESALEQAHEQLTVAAAAAVHQACGELLRHPFNRPIRADISNIAHRIVKRLLDEGEPVEPPREDTHAFSP